MENIKSEKLDRVYESVLIQCLKATGQLKISKSDLAKKANVSRAWIYKYCGRTDEELIRKSFEYFAMFFARQGHSLKPIRWTKKIWLDRFVQGFEEMLDDVEKFPWIMPMYYKFKGTNSLIGKMIQDYEQYYTRSEDAPRMAQVFKLKKEPSIYLAEVLLALRMGLTHQWAVDKDKVPRKKKFYIESVRTLAIRAVTTSRN